MKVSIEPEMLPKEVLNIRKSHKRIGTRKLYEMLTPDKVHHSSEPLHVKRIRKNYYPKNKLTVSAYQDQH